MLDARWRISTSGNSAFRLRSGAIAGLGMVLILAACSTSALNTSTPSTPTLTSSAESSPTETPSAAPQPLKADEIRSFLEQGSIEDSTQCPSKSVSATSEASLKKVAYFETTHYWVEICTHENGALEYYGRKRDRPDLDLALMAEAAGDRPNTFIAQNGNTLYKVSADELVVTQNGVPIIREPVTRSSFD